jgi:hypothetical protein
VVTDQVAYERYYGRHLRSPSSRIKVDISRCDISEKPYEAYESEISNPTSAISEDELEQQVPLLLLCDPCREELEVLPINQKPLSVNILDVNG